VYLTRINQLYFDRVGVVSQSAKMAFEYGHAAKLSLIGLIVVCIGAPFA